MKREYYLLGLLVIITATAVTNFWEIGMMGLTVFFLAYLTKGSRKVDLKKAHKNSQKFT